MAVDQDSSGRELETVVEGYTSTLQQDQSEREREEYHPQQPLLLIRSIALWLNPPTFSPVEGKLDPPRAGRRSLLASIRS